VAHFLVEYVELGDDAARADKRGEHIAYRKGLGNALALAGPLLDDENKPLGSVVILEAEDDSAAEKLALADPYIAAGVLELVSVRRYRIAAMKPPERA
jgi:uncharacterized protein YciI